MKMIKVRQVIGGYGEDQYVTYYYPVHRIGYISPVGKSVYGQKGRGRCDIGLMPLCEGDRTSIAVWETADEVLAMIDQD